MKKGEGGQFWSNLHDAIHESFPSDYQSDNLPTRQSFDFLFLFYVSPHHVTYIYLIWLIRFIEKVRINIDNVNVKVNIAYFS